MSVQVILREGQPEYAVLPWDEYQALLSAAGQSGGQEEAAPAPTRPAVWFWSGSPRCVRAWA